MPRGTQFFAVGAGPGLGLLQGFAVVSNVSDHEISNVAEQQLLQRSEEMEQDLMAARAVQRFLLPPEYQNHGTHRVAHLYQPLHHIGGDFLDVAAHKAGQTILMIGDVSGHGVAAAMSSAMLKTVFVRHATATAEPGEVLTRADQDLAGMVRFGRFITALVATFDPATRTVKLASAGHPPPLLLRGSEAQSITMENDLPLLTGETPLYATTASVTLQPHDRLLLYTDGVIEAVRGDGELLGIEGLKDLVTRRHMRTGTAFLEAMFQDLFFGDCIFNDDVSFLCLEC